MSNPSREDEGPCDYCDCTGMVDCPEMCEGDDPECPVCGGTGEYECFDCDGTGEYL